MVDVVAAGAAEAGAQAHLPLGWFAWRGGGQGVARPALEYPNLIQPKFAYDCPWGLTGEVVGKWCPSRCAKGARCCSGKIGSEAE